MALLIVNLEYFNKYTSSSHTFATNSLNRYVYRTVTTVTKDHFSHSFSKKNLIF